MNVRELKEILEAHEDDTTVFLTVVDPTTGEAAYVLVPVGAVTGYYEPSRVGLSTVDLFFGQVDTNHMKTAIYLGGVPE